MFRAQFGIKESDQVFLAVGTFENRKHITDIVAAFIRLNKIGCWLILVGELPIPNEVSSDIKKMIGKNKRILIYKIQNNLDLFYAGADFFVHAACEETMPLVLQEAALWGLPRIISKYSGFDELVESETFGLLFEVGNIGELTHQMEFALGHEEVLTQMAFYSREFQIHSVSKGSEAMREIIQESLLGSLTVVPEKWIE